MTVSLPAGQYDTSQKVASYWARALPSVRDIPGVLEAGLCSSLPPDDFESSNNNFSLIGRPVAPGTAEPSAPWPSALGLIVALVATGTLTTVLYDVSAADPATLTLATLTLLSVALLACWLPARRAASIDPLDAIRPRGPTTLSGPRITKPIW